MRGVPILVLGGVALITRLIIIDWTLPYAANPAHEHSMIYDSQAVVHDQYRALFALYRFPKGLIADAREAYWPLLQRYIAALPLGVWLAAEHGWDQQVVLAAPFVETAYKTILINRLVSVVSSIIALLLFWKLLRRFLPETLAFVLTAIFMLTVSEIGTSIHEKTISLLTVMYLAEAVCLERWTRGNEFKYLAGAFFFIGLAGTAREYGFLFGGLLALLVVISVLGRNSLKFLFSWRSPALLGATVAAIALTSPDMLVKIPYWTAAVLEPGGRTWYSTSLTTMVPELWALAKLLFGGSIGTGIGIAALISTLATWRQYSPFVRAVLVWVLLYLIVFIAYPLKEPRFIAGLVPFVFLFIGLFLQNWNKVSGTLRSKYLTPSLLALWFGQALLWAVSAWVFFSGWDTRIKAADEFNATLPPGTSVATFFAPYYNRQIPIDDKKFKQYTYDHLHSAVSDIRYIKDGQGDDGDSGIWPEYVFIDYETGGYTYPSDQVSIHKFRNSILASQRYELLKFYPKRRWQLGDYGLFGTKSRWLYFNPVVEVYKLKQ